MNIFLILKAFKTGNNFVNSLKETIKNIEAELKSMYLDLADAHFQSAKDSLESANSGADIHSAIRESITHLRSAFFINQSALDRKVKKNVLIFFTREMPFLEVIDSVSVLKKQIEIGALIMVIYNFLKDEENKNLWKKRIGDISILYINKKHDFLINRYKYGFSMDLVDDMLEKLDSKESRFIIRHFTSDEEKKAVEIFKHNKNDAFYTSELHPSQYRTYTSYKITPYGENYLTDNKKKELQTLLENISYLSTERFD